MAIGGKVGKWEPEPMIDKIHTRHCYKTKKEAERILSTLEYTGTSKKQGIFLKKYLYKTLHVESNPIYNSVIIKNSLIKFRHGNNYADLTYADLTQCIDHISEKFKKCPSEIRVHGFEFSLTVVPPIDPVIYIDNFKALRSIPYKEYNSEKYTCSHGKYCSLSQYTNKIYDCGRWNDVNGEWFLRWETNFRKMQKVTKITGEKIITLDSFRSKEFLEKLSLYSLADFSQSEKLPIINYCLVSPRDREKISLVLTPEYWDREKTINYNTAKGKQNKYRKIYANASALGNDPYIQLEELLKQKFHSLLNSNAEYTPNLPLVSTAMPPNIIMP